MARICLDAGHYGKYNRSPANAEYYESERMWTLHLMLRDELEKRGIETVQTRGDQALDLSLVQRGRAAEGCDLFLSLHSNAAAEGVREDIDYPVSYVSISGEADEIGRLLAQCVGRVMGTVQPARIEKRTGSTGADYYGVLRGASQVRVPGVILEHSFHTDTDMTAWLLNDGNLKRLAAAEAEVLAGYFAARQEVPVPRYRHLSDIPVADGFRDVIAELMEKGVVKGDGSDPAGNGDVIDLSRDMVRMLVFLKRAGIFDGIR